jgi:hypothetical protein
MSRLSAVAVFVALLALPIVASVLAQDAPRPNQNRPRPGNPGANVPREDVRLSGTIKAMQGGLLHVVNEEGGEWIVKPPDRGLGVTVSGSATREWLERGGARGLHVRFVGTFDRSGKPQAPINQLLVFSPRQWGAGREDEYKVGVYPEGASGELKGLFAGEGEQKAAPEIMDYRVVGQLAGVGDGAITVAAGGARVGAKLADDAGISFNVADLRYAQLGDKIDVDGWHLPGMAKQVYANRITITTAKALGSAPPEEKKGAKDPKNEAK